MRWIEKKPVEGDTVKIFWSEWYAKQIGRKSDVGVVVGTLSYSTGLKYKIDIGSRHVHIPMDGFLEVFEK